MSLKRPLVSITREVSTWKISIGLSQVKKTEKEKILLLKFKAISQKVVVRKKRNKERKLNKPPTEKEQ